MTSYELNEINGIGEKKLETLKNAGINSVEQLANSTINKLKKLDGIGKKSAESFIKRAKKLLNKTSGSVQKEQEGGFIPNNSTIPKIQSDIELIFSKLENLEKKIETLENQFQGKKRVSDINISDDHFYRVLKSAYNSMTKKLGGFVHISDLTQNIMEHLPISKQKVHQKLYSLFMDYKVELQPGKSDHGEALVQDGKTFVWFKLK